MTKFLDSALLFRTEEELCVHAPEIEDQELESD